MGRLQKIDIDGNFTYFPGVTVIAKIRKMDHQFWKKIYDTLDRCHQLKQHYSLLPYESYHITAYNLYTKNNYVDDWDQLFRENNLTFFKELSLLLKDNFPDPLTVSITRLNSTGVLQFIVQLTDDDINKIKRLSKHFGLEKSIPRKYHITLAYQYKPIDEKRNARIHKQLDGEFSKLFNQSNLMQFNPPKLCYFNDMTQFHSWTVDYNPFSSEETAPTRLFSKKKPY